MLNDILIYLSILFRKKYAKTYDITRPFSTAPHLTTYAHMNDALCSYYLLSQSDYA